MKLRNQLNRVLCGAGLALVLTVLPVSLALSPTGQVAAGPSSSTASKMGPMDINTATVDQLRTLSGIGDTYARRIVSGRPYASKNQLVTKGILPRNVYDKVQNQIIASHVKK